MRVTDAALLAYTKFRARVFRSIVIGIMAGLLFAVLILGSLVFAGVARGVESYAAKGYGNRYIVSLNVVTDFMKIQEEITKRQIAKEAELIAEAKKKNEFNPESPPSLSEKDFMAINNAVQNELYPPKTLEQVKSELAPYGPKAVYQSTALSGGPNTSGARLTPIVDGKELAVSENFYGSNKSIDSFMLQAKSWDLVKPFELDSSVMADQSKLPLLIPMDTALGLAGITVDEKSPLKDQVNLKQQARKQVLGDTFPVCYRNETAQMLLSEAKSQAEILEKNKDNKDYKKPALLYGVPKDTCAPVEVVKDSRTKEEKDADAKLKLADAKPEPVTQIIDFTIAGFVPSMPNFSTFDFSFILQTGPQGEFIMPFERISQNKYLNEAATLSSNSQFAMNGLSASYYAEFNSRAEQKRYIEESCQTDAGINVDPFTDCLNRGVQYTAVNYGNPRVQVEEQAQSVIRGSRVVITIMFAMASILMMLAISKVIADSRRETGVFRAIGARRRDIAQIYLTYSAYLALFSFAIALAIASGFAIWLTGKYSDRLTLQAIDNFAVYENPARITLIGIDLKQMLYILGIAILAGLVGGLIPITGNVRRNPIKDMRDE